MQFGYTLLGSTVPCELYAEKYTTDGSLALIAIIAEDFDDGNVQCEAGEEMATITVNLGLDLKPNQCALDTNNNKNIMQDLKRENLGHFTGDLVSSGFCEYPIWEFSNSEMKEFSRF